MPFYDLDGKLKKNLTFATGSGEVFVYKSDTNTFVASANDAVEVGGANTSGQYSMQFTQAEVNKDTIVGVKLVKSGYDDQFWWASIDNTSDINVLTWLGSTPSALVAGDVPANTKQFAGTVLPAPTVAGIPKVEDATARTTVTDIQTDVDEIQVSIAAGLSSTQVGFAATLTRNELVAARRHVTLFPVKVDGITLAPRYTDFTGCALIDQSSGVYIPGVGTIANATKRLTLADVTFGAASGNQVPAAAHPFENGDGPVQLTTTGALPTGLVVLTDVYVNVVDANTLSFSTTRQNAYDAVVITLSSAGSGTNKITCPLSGGLSLTRRGLDGIFVYTATQAETDFAGDEFIVRLEKTLFRTAVSRASMGTSQQGFEAIAEGSVTYGDVQRVLFAILGGISFDYTTGTYSWKDPSTGTKTRMSHTADPTGRLSATIGDVTP
jgi:hypothetical protein